MLANLRGSILQTHLLFVNEVQYSNHMQLVAVFRNTT